LFRLSADCKWHGPIHELIIWSNSEITTGIIEGLTITHEKNGHSWNGDLFAKYRGYAAKLEEFIKQSERNGRWVFFTGNCYKSAADYCEDQEQKISLYKRAFHYYQESVEIQSTALEERYLAQMHIATIYQLLKHPWQVVEQEILKAHQIDPIRAEPIARIIDHYVRREEWTLAYPFSNFLIQTYQNKEPKHLRFFYVQSLLYGWKALCSHIIISYFSKHKSEAKMVYKSLIATIVSDPSKFSKKEVLFIFSHSPHRLWFSERFRKIKSLFDISKRKGFANQPHVSDTLYEKEQRC
jgi:hypothetical protein